ncbi:bifunctional riboflavin kinase/FAD synthetase [Celerinatantimonas diazotrophica]|uniref:Riboflavin biosynthesis protein n=1 Tax=Celerinatantimonas diazotrophica TaxID=412034 RepID=A0A4R1JAB3_9GAMM|nr:bifunctional riboflavin kinase/FAD synthetase [Celerinatantimonas diazotrophica]TCK47039.1 FMN adenylyltransferase /riboflavin kinase [Celerinatantimonas diazotrophica]CAG9295807.1 Bifunctional riboflavin kinase/FMN adenylyltransferase [Celerinatantimonas diazotrophica]
MKLIRGINNIRAEHAGSVLTIGNFDGVHRGHQQVITQLLDKARVAGKKATVMLFEPQPMEFFAPDRAPERISSFRDKYCQLAALGVDQLLVVRFCQQFSSYSAEQFIEHLLVNKLAVSHLVIGDDFRFGQARRGDYDMLCNAGEKYGFSVQNTQSFCQKGLRVSSTGIRQALHDGDFDRVSQWMGRRYQISAKVSYGQQLGRTLGFPTANLRLPRGSSPLRGVYAVLVRRVGEKDVVWPAIANLGKRPTANGRELLLEVHILNQKLSLYGQRLVVEPLWKLRDEIKFDSLDSLKTQVNADIRRARIWFNNQDYLTGTVDR